MPVLVSFKVTGDKTFVYVKNVESGAHSQINERTPFTYNDALDNLVVAVRTLTSGHAIACVAGAIDATMDEQGKVTNCPLLPDWIRHNPPADLEEVLEAGSIPLRIINCAIPHTELKILTRSTSGFMPEALRTAHSLE